MLPPASAKLAYPAVCRLSSNQTTFLFANGTESQASVSLGVCLVCGGPYPPVNLEPSRLDPRSASMAEAAAPTQSPSQTTDRERGEAPGGGGAIDTSWLDGIIEKLNGLYNRTDIGITNVVQLDEIIAILTFVTKIINQEGSLVEVEVPIKVVGDIHGQYQDMHKLFDLIGRVPDQKMLFLGDYVDRGPQSLETIVLLFALKLRHREKLYLLRGNHETPAVNRIYGFYDECCRKYGVGLWWEFQTVFNRLPMAGLISKRILCMHGGLSPELTNLDQIRAIVRPCEPQDRGMLIDLLWSDPTNKGDGWFYSPRGISYAFGKGVMAAACKILGIDMVIRAHQVVQDGYELMIGRQLITIFSAPNYCGQFNNAAAVVCIDADMMVSFQQLRTQAPPNCNRPAPPVAADLSVKPSPTPPTFKIVPAQEPSESKESKDKDTNNNTAEEKSSKDEKK